MLLMLVRFSADGQFVVAAEQNYMLVWRTDECTLIHAINIHSVGKYPIGVSVAWSVLSKGGLSVMIM